VPGASSDHINPLDMNGILQDCSGLALQITALSGIELLLSEGSHLNTWDVTPSSLVDLHEVFIADSDGVQGSFLPQVGA